MKKRRSQSFAARAAQELWVLRRFRNDRQKRDDRRKLEQAFRVYESQRAMIQERVAPLSDEQLRWSPSADVWSAAQILEHLVLSDEFVGAPVDRRKVKNESLLLRLIPRRARRRFLVRSFEQDRSLPMVIGELAPEGNVMRADLLRRWEATRVEMSAGLERGAGNLRYFHRILGPMTLPQVLEIGHAHAAYHARQLSALLQREDFPP